MQYEWESESKRLQTELGDPLLKVVWDTEFKEYHVLKLMPGGYDYIPLFVDGTRANLFYPTSYWYVNKRFKHWDGRVCPEMRASRYGYKDVKTRCWEGKEDDERRRRSQRRVFTDIGREAGKDFYYELHPRKAMSLPPGAGQFLVPKGVIK